MKITPGNVRFIVMVSVGIAASVSPLGSGCAKRNATDTRQTLQAFYDEQAAGYNAQDLNKAYARFAPDCVFIGEQNRTYGLTQERAEMTRMFGQSKSDLHFFSAIHAVAPNTPNAPEVTVSLTRHITSTILWRKTMQSAPVNIDAEVRDFWVKEPSGWQIKREKIGTPQMTIDGKPFSP